MKYNLNKTTNGQIFKFVRVKKIRQKEWCVIKKTNSRYHGKIGCFGYYYIFGSIMHGVLKRKDRLEIEKFCRHISRRK